jgi:PTH1 family peptidyl-tRNA hydrolase
MKLIVGLGNPGKIYTRNRHNVGFRCLDYFARRYSIRFNRKECHAKTGTGQLDGEELLLAKPQTFVNASGDAVRCLVDKYDTPLGDILVVYDDLDLPLGKIRLRRGGGSGGHKGVDSIISTLGSKNFPRLRVGIGRPEVNSEGKEDDDMVIVNYVLSDFGPHEEAIIKIAIIRAAEAISSFIRKGIEVAMNEFN